MAVAERVRAGQNVQFHLREAAASQDEAVALLKAATADSGDSVHFGLLMACLGRGQGLFGRADGDISLARQLMPDLLWRAHFATVKSDPSGTTHLHGYTACWACCARTPTALAMALTISVERSHRLGTLRQHVNPLSSFFQLPLELPPPEELFRVPDQPIHLDIGCARGRACWAWPSVPPLEPSRR